MHTCLTLTNVGGQWYVEREVSGLISKLRSYCDSIHSSDISVEGPSDGGEARRWSVGLKLRVFDEIVHVVTHASAGVDPHQSLSRALADIYAKAGVQLDHISARHHSCCCRGGHGSTERLEACA